MLRFFLALYLCTSYNVLCNEFTLGALINENLLEYLSFVNLAIVDINENPEFLPNTTIVLDRKATNIIAVEIEDMIELSARNTTLIIGNEFSSSCVLTGVVGNVYNVAQLSVTATSSILSDDFVYPYFSRVSAPSTGQAFIILETLVHFQELSGPGWTDIAVISTTEAYGVDGSRILIENAESYGCTIKTYQQFINNEFTFDVELREIANSGARVIVAFVIGSFEELIAAADEFGLVGEQYVWIVPDAIAGSSPDQLEGVDVNRLMNGVLGSFQFLLDSGDKYEELVNHWMEQDPELYPTDNVRSSPSPYSILAYDTVFVAAKAIEILEKSGELYQERIPAESWISAIRSIHFQGFSGFIEFDEIGDPVPAYSISYYNSEEDAWIRSAVWSEGGEYEVEKSIIWFSNSTTIPDLDIREPFYYWSCDDAEMKYDASGKTVEKDTPDGGHVDDIDSSYYCDQYIDCYNLSDETKNCSQNYTILFIIFGIVTGILVLISVALLAFVILFGIILKYRRLRVSSPTFLVIILLSILMGYLSVFTWFGKPHPIACFFRPWLLGVSVISMVSAIGVKIFRIWRIFSVRKRLQRISDLHLFFIWLFLILPVLFLLTLWSIIATPTASMSEEDGKDHFLCVTGGFSGSPGGIIFFSLIIAYVALILFLGMGLSLLARNVPSMFNESKLLAVSIYNLVFLSVVIIPVFIVVENYNPFIAWILRTSAVIYAFTATLLLQFAPPLIGIIVIDRFSNPKSFTSAVTSNPGSSITNSSN